MNLAYSKEDIIQNLIDAGCNEEMINEYFRFDREGKFDHKIKLLERHRMNLLDNLHREQKKIDCLDYLIYRMKERDR